MRISRATLLELVKELKYQRQRLTKVIAVKGSEEGVIDSCRRMVILHQLLLALLDGEPIEVVEDEKGGEKHGSALCGLHSGYTT